MEASLHEAEGVAIGREALDSGAAAARLKQLIAISNR